MPGFIGFLHSMLSSVEFPWKVSEDLEVLLRGLLEKDPSKRWDFPEIHKNPWVICDLPRNQQESYPLTNSKGAELAEIPEIKI